MRLSTIVVALLATSCACTQEAKHIDEIPPAPKVSGDGLGTPIGDMCKHLRDLGCADGFEKKNNGKTRTCYESLVLSQMPMPLDCVSRAQSLEAVRACGDARREVTFRCRLQ